MALFSHRERRIQILRTQSGTDVTIWPTVLKNINLLAVDEYFESFGSFDALESFEGVLKRLKKLETKDSKDSKDSKH